MQTDAQLAWKIAEVFEGDEQGNNRKHTKEIHLLELLRFYIYTPGKPNGNFSEE